MLRPRGPCGLEAKSFRLGLTLSGLGLDLGLVASGLVASGLGLGLIEIGLVIYWKNSCFSSATIARTLDLRN